MPLDFIRPFMHRAGLSIIEINIQNDTPQQKIFNAWFLSGCISYNINIRNGTEISDNLILSTFLS